MDVQATPSGPFYYSRSNFATIPIPITTTVKSSLRLFLPSRTANPIRPRSRIRLYQSITRGALLCFTRARVPEDGRGLCNAVYADIRKEGAGCQVERLCFADTCGNMRPNDEELRATMGALSMSSVCVCEAVH